jgi:hypothetical protein
MNRFHWISGVVLLLLGGCGETQRPTFCVVSATELSQQGSGGQGGTGGSGQGAAERDFDCDVNLKAVDEAERVEAPAAIADGEVYFVRHQLPEGVAPLGELKLHVETPCAKEDIEATHVDGVVFLTRIAPPGAACSFSITAVMANSELRAEVPRDAAECAKLEAAGADACGAVPPE